MIGLLANDNDAVLTNMANGVRIGGSAPFSPAVTNFMNFPRLCQTGPARTFGSAGPFSVPLGLIKPLVLPG